MGYTSLLYNQQSTIFWELPLAHVFTSSDVGFYVQTLCPRIPLWCQGCRLHVPLHQLRLKYIFNLCSLNHPYTYYLLIFVCFFYQVLRENATIVVVSFIPIYFNQFWLIVWNCVIGKMRFRLWYLFCLFNLH